AQTVPTVSPAPSTSIVSPPPSGDTDTPVVETTPAPQATDTPTPLATASLIAKFVPGLSPIGQQIVVARDGGVEVSSVPALRLHVIEVPSATFDETLQAYQSDTQVQSVELNQQREADAIPSDASYAEQWALSK